MAKKKAPRPIPATCESAEDHEKHLWWPESWAPHPSGVMYHCRGYNRAEAAAGAAATARAVKRAAKHDKGSRGRARRARKAARAA